MTSGFEDWIDQQIHSPLFQLPAELRWQIFQGIMPVEVTLHSPSDRQLYQSALGQIVGGIMLSCKRGMQEVSNVPLPHIHLRLPSLDAEANLALSTFPTRLLPSIKTVAIASPNWVVRPDRFQWSSDPQASLRFDAANDFFSRTLNMEVLIIEAPGQSFSGLVNATLRQLEPLRVRQGVEVEIKVSTESVPNRAMGPSKDTVEEVISAIKGC